MERTLAEERGLSTRNLQPQAGKMGGTHLQHNNSAMANLSEEKGEAQEEIDQLSHRLALHCTTTTCNAPFHPNDGVAGDWWSAFFQTSTLPFTPSISPSKMRASPRSGGDKPLRLAKFSPRLPHELACTSCSRPLRRSCNLVGPRSMLPLSLSRANGQ